MTHISLADEALLLFLVLMTLLLVMFIGAVIVAPPEGPAPAHVAAPEPPAPDPSWPDPAQSARQPPAPASPAGLAAGAGPVVTQATAPAPPAPKLSSERQPRLARAVGIAGLALASVALTVIGWMVFRRPVHGGLACSHHTGAICMDGFVLVTGTQVIGVATALAGIALFFTAAILALRN